MSARIRFFIGQNWSSNAVDTILYKNYQLHGFVFSHGGWNKHQITIWITNNKNYKISSRIPVQILWISFMEFEIENLADGEIKSLWYFT